MTTPWNQHDHLDKTVDVRDQTVDAHFNKHHQRSANVLANFRVFIRRQEEQTLHTTQSITDINTRKTTEV